MDIMASLNASVVTIKGETMMNVLIREDLSGTLVLEETTPPQFTPHRKHYATKTIWFSVEIMKCSIKLLKIDTVKQLGGLFTKRSPCTTFWYLRKKLMSW